MFAFGRGDAGSMVSGATGRYVYDDDLSDLRAVLSQGWVAVSSREWRYENGERRAMHVLVVPVERLTSLVAASGLTALL